MRNFFAKCQRPTCGAQQHLVCDAKLVTAGPCPDCGFKYVLAAVGSMPDWFDRSAPSKPYVLRPVSMPGYAA